MSEDTNIGESVEAIREAFKHIQEELIVERPCPHVLSEALRSGFAHTDNIEKLSGKILDTLI